MNVQKVERCYNVNVVSGAILGKKFKFSFPTKEDYDDSLAKIEIGEVKVKGATTCESAYALAATLRKLADDLILVYGKAEKVNETFSEEITLTDEEK